MRKASLDNRRLRHQDPSRYLPPCLEQLRGGWVSLSRQHADGGPGKSRLCRAASHRGPTHRTPRIALSASLRAPRKPISRYGRVLPTLSAAGVRVFDHPPQSESASALCSIRLRSEELLSLPLLQGIYSSIF